MKMWKGLRWLVPCIAAMLLMVPGKSLRAQGGEPLVLSSRELTWSDDARATQDRSKNSGKPMLLYLFTNNAIGCRDIEQITFRHQPVVDQMKLFELVAVNVSKNPDIQRSLQVIRVPTTILYSGRGEEMLRAVGYKTPDDFQGYLEAIPKPKTGTAYTQADAANMTATFDPSKLVLTPRPGTRKIQLSIRKPHALTVSLMGEFNDWKTDTLPMNFHQESGYWWIDLYLADGLYHYKFVLDGKQEEDSNATYRKWISQEIGYASTLVVGRMPGPEIKDGKATFLYYNREAQVVTLQITSPGGTGMKEHKMFAKGDGNFGITLPLPPGIYDYYFDMDGKEWYGDDSNPVGGQRAGSSFLEMPAN